LFQVELGCVRSPETPRKGSWIGECQCEIVSRFVDACIQASVERVTITEVICSSAYATAADFDQIFTQEMSDLYLLSFLLTADRKKAEECFVTGIGESAKANRVFKEWARSWARRTIIQSAIRPLLRRWYSDRYAKPFRCGNHG
jgi:hypothetical protein